MKQAFQTQINTFISLVWGRVIQLTTGWFQKSSTFIPNWWLWMTSDALLVLRTSMIEVYWGLEIVSLLVLLSKDRAALPTWEQKYSMSISACRRMKPEVSLEMMFGEKCSVMQVKLRSSIVNSSGLSLIIMLRRGSSYPTLRSKSTKKAWNMAINGSANLNSRNSQ